MVRKFLLIVAALAALAGQPLAAQEQAEGEREREFLAIMEKFKPQPLTAAQQARRPLAGTIIDKMMPPGTLGEMMGSMFDSLLGPMMDIAGKPSSRDVAKHLGIESDLIELDEQQANEALAILDPAWLKRQQRVAKAMPGIIGNLMTAMEPTMRNALTDAYAVYFNETELTDIDRFFSTESGIAYARKSFSMSSDPRFLGAMMEGMPTMMESASEMERAIRAATSDLPDPRSYAELSSKQLKKLSELTKLKQDTIRQGMEAAAAAEMELEGQ